jgi:hypothetical protein
MIGGQSPPDPIKMAGMFGVLFREHSRSGTTRPRAWYREKPGVLAALAPADVLAKTGIAVDGSAARKPRPGVNAARPSQTDARTRTAPHAPAGGGQGDHGAAAAGGVICSCPHPGGQVEHAGR